MRMTNRFKHFKLGETIEFEHAELKEICSSFQWYLNGPFKTAFHSLLQSFPDVILEIEDDTSKISSLNPETHNVQIVEDIESMFIPFSEDIK